MPAGIRWVTSSADDSFIAWPGLFASRLAPTVDLCSTQILCSLKIYCGSEPAREGASRNTAKSCPNPRLQTQIRPLPRLQAQAVGAAASRLYANEFRYLIPTHPQQRPRARMPDHRVGTGTRIDT